MVRISDNKLIVLLTLAASIILILNLATSVAGSVGGNAPGGVSNNLQLWLKAGTGTDTTTNYAEVTTWDDQSPNGWTADNSVDNKPTYQIDAINFNPALSFGLNGRAELSINNDYPQSLPGSTGLTIFSVFKPITDTTNGNFIVDVGQATGNGYGMMGSLSTYSGYNSNTNTGGTGNGISPLFGPSLGQVPALLTHQVQFGTGRTAYLNGAPISSTINVSLNRLDNNNIDFTSNHLTSSGPLTFGRQAKNGNITMAGGRYFRGDIAEVIIYNADINGQAKTQVESYLAVKYGLTLTNTLNYLASDGTIIYPSQSTHSGYTDDIAGIGVDDGSMLVQLASRSINIDSMVTMTGTTNTMSNNEFLIWGNDDGSLTPSSNVPTGSPTPQRINRVWRAAETGDVGNVAISFDLSDFPGTIAFEYPAGFVLLIDDDDGDFSNSQLIYNPTVTGQVVTFTDVNFTNGDFFTIAYPTDVPVFNEFIPALYQYPLF